MPSRWRSLLPNCSMEKALRQRKLDAEAMSEAISDMVEDVTTLVAGRRIRADIAPCDRREHQKPVPIDRRKVATR